MALLPDTVQCSMGLLEEYQRQLEFAMLCLRQERAAHAKTARQTVVISTLTFFVALGLVRQSPWPATFLLITISTFQAGYVLNAAWPCFL